MLVASINTLSAYGSQMIRFAEPSEWSTFNLVPVIVGMLNTAADNLANDFLRNLASFRQQGDQALVAASNGNIGWGRAYGPRVAAEV